MGEKKNLYVSYQHILPIDKAKPYSIEQEPSYLLIEADDEGNFDAAGCHYFKSLDELAGKVSAYVLEEGDDPVLLRNSAPYSVFESVRADVDECYFDGNQYHMTRRLSADEWRELGDKVLGALRGL